MEFDMPLVNRPPGTGLDSQINVTLTVPQAILRVSLPKIALHARRSERVVNWWR
jgi:hypothetical protein